MPIPARPRGRKRGPDQDWATHQSNKTRGQGFIPLNEVKRNHLGTRRTRTRKGRPSLLHGAASRRLTPGSWLPRAALHDLCMKQSTPLAIGYAFFRGALLRSPKEAPCAHSTSHT